MLFLLFQVVAWAKQHQQRLAGALAALIANQELLEALLSWLQWAETTLTEKDKEVIPQEIDDVKALIAEHQVRENMVLSSSSFSAWAWVALQVGQTFTKLKSLHCSHI